MTILQGSPKTHRRGIRDGHTLELVIKDEQLRLQWVCPHQGITFTSIDSPVCRTGSDDGTETVTSDCIPGAWFADLQAEAFTIDPTTVDGFAVPALPIHVEWWVDYGEELYVRPYLPEYTDPATLTAGITQGWAEAETDPTRIDWSLRQAMALIPFTVVDGRPVTPGPKTAIQRGRNQLGRWGENPMADALVIARLGWHEITPDGWRRPTTSRYLLMIERDDDRGWAIPGGAIEPGETPIEAAARELTEEAGLQIPATWWRADPPRWVPDPRGSDEAWAVTVLAHAKLGPRTSLPEVQGGDDARRAAWILADTYADLVTTLADDYDGTVFAAHVDLLTTALAEPGADR